MLSHETMLNTAMNLLRQVHENVEIGALPKDFWIQLGMLYKGYREQSELQEKEN